MSEFFDKLTTEYFRVDENLSSLYKISALAKLTALEVKFYSPERPVFNLKTLIAQNSDSAQYVMLVKHKYKDYNHNKTSKNSILGAARFTIVGERVMIVNFIYVNKAIRRMGVGTFIMNSLEKFAEKRELKLMFITENDGHKHGLVQKLFLGHFKGFVTPSQQLLEYNPNAKKDYGDEIVIND